MNHLEPDMNMHEASFPRAFLTFGPNVTRAPGFVLMALLMLLPVSHSVRGHSAADFIKLRLTALYTYV